MDDPRLRLLGAAEVADADRLLAALDTVRPIVTVSPGLPGPAAGAALTLVAVLSRLFPHVQVDGSAQAGPNPWGITDVAGAVDWFRAVRPVPTAACRHRHQDVPRAAGWWTRPGPGAGGRRG